jgi:hypothetical protein
MARFIAAKWLQLHTHRCVQPQPGYMAALQPFAALQPGSRVSDTRAPIDGGKRTSGYQGHQLPGRGDHRSCGSGRSLPAAAVMMADLIQLALQMSHRSLRVRFDIG